MIAAIARGRARQVVLSWWVLVVFAAFAAVLATLLSSASASAASTTRAETRVGASSVVVEVPVGSPQRIAAGQRLGNNATGPEIVVATGVAAKGGDETVQLFRSVDAGEFDSIASTGRFSTAPGQMEGKFFATTGEHAEQWGQLLHGGDALTVETRVPRSVADQLFLREGKLDGVGPAFYADGGQLDLINSLMDGIRLWP